VGGLKSVQRNAGSSLSYYTRARGRSEFKPPVKSCEKTKQVSAVDDCQRIALRRKFLNLFFYERMLLCWKQVVVEVRLRDSKLAKLRC